MRSTNTRFGLCAVLTSLSCLHCGSDTTPPAATSAAGQTGASAGGSSSDAAGSAGSAQSSSGAAAGGSAGSAGSFAAAGGSSSGAGAGGGSAGTAPSNSCADRTICEDFEAMPLGSEPKSPFTIRKSKDSGTVTVDGTHVHSGKQALKVSITATTTADHSRQAMLALTGAPLLPLANNSLYGRFMIYTDRIPDKSVHWTIAHGDGPYQDTTATYNYGGMGGLMANYYRNTKDPADSTKDKPTDCWQSNTQPFPTGKWTCVAFHFDGPKDEMQFWIDGTEISDLHVLGDTKTPTTCVDHTLADGKWHAPAPFKNITVGWESYQHDVAGAHDAWIDDLVLDESPISCP